MNILVTGATGFVGSHLVDNSTVRGESVRALVRDPLRSAALEVRGIELSQGDLSDRESLRRAVQGVQVVFHCAAAESDSPHVQREVNLEGARALFDAVLEAGRPRIVLLSGLNVLGLRNLDPATEDLPCRRSGDPGADTKVEIEELARAYHRDRGLDVVILRPGLVVGPRDRRNIPKLIKAIRRGKFAFIGSREHVTPLVHVTDLVQAMWLAATTPNAGGGTYNITDGSRTTIGELVDHLAELLRCPAPDRVVPYWVPRMLVTIFNWMARLRGDEKRKITRSILFFLGTSRFVDIGRAQAELGYAPRVGFREGIADAVRWFEDQQRDVAEAASTAA